MLPEPPPSSVLPAGDPFGRAPSRLGVGSGFAAAVVGGCLFGGMTPFAKSVLAGLPPLFASGWLYFTAGIVFVPWLLVRPARGAARLERGDVRWLALGTFAGSVVAPWLYVRGLAANPPYVTALLLNLEAVFVPLLAATVFGEPIGRRRAAGIAVLAGTGFFTTAMAVRGEGGGGATVAGAAWIAGACLAWAVDTNATRPVSGRDPRAVVVVHNVIGGGASLLLCAATGAWPASVPGRTLLLAALVGVVAYGLQFLLLVHALSRIGAARAGALFLVAGVAAGVVASSLASGEPPPAWIFGSAALVAGGVVLLATERRRRG